MRVPEFYFYLLAVTQLLCFPLMMLGLVGFYRKLPFGVSNTYVLRGRASRLAYLLCIIVAILATYFIDHLGRTLRG
jgi:hypothetical protein